MMYACMKPQIKSWIKVVLKKFWRAMQSMEESTVLSKLSQPKHLLPVDLPWWYNIPAKLCIVATELMKLHSNAYGEVEFEWTP